MTDHFDLDWLAAAQPAGPAPDPLSALQARSELLGHIVSVERPLALVRPKAPVRRMPERRWLRPSRVLALAGVAAAVAVAAVTGGNGRGHSVVGVDQAAAAPLARLAARVRASAPQPGDATLVLRLHTFADGSTMTGADLYLDDGTYYYSPTRAGLPAQIAAKADQGGGFIERDVAAAVAALHGDLTAARARMAKAALDPDAPPAPAPPAASLDPVVRKQLELKASIAKGGGIPPATPEMLENGNIWSNSLDALTAEGSRPDVRAGVLRLLATIPQVSVTNAALDGRPVLDLVSSVWSDRYTERLVIDAATGMPLRFVGGNPGKQPDVVMTYEVARVSAADIAKG